MDFYILCSLHLWTRDIPSRSYSTISVFLNIILGAFMGVQMCWLLLYAPRKQSRGKDPFSLSGMLYICPGEKKTTIFQPIFQPFCRHKWLLRLSLMLTFLRLFFPMRKWNENSRQPTGSNDFQSPRSKSYREKKSRAFGFYFCCKSCLVFFFFFFWTTNLPFLSSTTDWHWHKSGNNTLDFSEDKVAEGE